MENSQTTLKDFLKSINKEPMFQDKTKKGYTGKYTSFSEEQLKLLQEKTKENNKIVSINNKHEATVYINHGQTVRYDCIIKTTELPSKILV